MPNSAASTSSTPSLFEVGKTCRQCGNTKPESAFHRCGEGNNRRPTCGECRSENRRTGKERRLLVPETSEQRLIRKLWGEYGLTLAQYAAMAEAQGSVCAICKAPPAASSRLCVDHCHATGVVRALLCTRCNVMVGAYENYREAASQYLATYGAGNPLLPERRPNDPVCESA